MSSEVHFLALFHQLTLHSSYQNDPLRTKAFVSRLLNIPAMITYYPYQVAILWYFSILPQLVTSLILCRSILNTIHEALMIAGGLFYIQHTDTQFTSSFF